jgi:hypothetical protein
MTASANKLNYSLAIRGIWGRNRKPKFEIFSLVKHVDPADPKTVVELWPIMHAKLIEIKAKPGLIYSLREEPVEVSTYDLGDGHVGTTEGFVLMSERVMVKGVVGGTEEIVKMTASEEVKETEV